MRITVVTPVRNGARFIRETVESVLSQEGDFDLEYRVRDGCSTDDTLNILEEYALDSRLQVVSRPDSSPQEAINAGMASAGGDVGCWLNSDDLFEPGALEHVARTFRTHPRSRWAYGRCRVIDGKGRELRKWVTRYKHTLGYFYSRNLLLCENYINQPATFWRMDLWRQVADLGTEFKAAWDYELWLRMAAITRPRPIHAPIARFRRHETSISETIFERQFREELAIAARYGSAVHRMLHQWLIRIRIAMYRRMAQAERRL